ELLTNRPIKDAEVTFFRIEEREVPSAKPLGNTANAPAPPKPATAIWLPEGRPGKTAEDGTYGLPFLAPGKYRLTVEAEGYYSVSVDDIQVAVASHVDLDIRLKSKSEEARRKTFYKGLLLPGGQIVNYFGVDAGTGALDAELPAPKNDTREASL